MNKKVITLFVLLFSISISYAQIIGTGGVRRGGTSMDMRNKMKERLKTELGLSDAKIDSVVAIQQTYQYKVRAIKMDTNLNEESKKTKVAEVDGERKQKLREVISDEEIAKLDAFAGSRTKMRGEAKTQPDK